jgi:polyhydroxyalkanoate synthesis regulator phasin
VAGDKHDDERSHGRADAVRSAAMQALEAAAGQAGFTRERAAELADELVQAAGRIRGALDDVLPASADDVRSLRDELRALEVRVAKLETATGVNRRRRPPRPPRPPG